MSSRLPLIVLLALAGVGAAQAQAQTAPRAPTARELVERQLAKPAPPPSQTPRLSTAEAQAIRERLIERIGQEARGAEGGTSPASTAPAR